MTPNQHMEEPIRGSTGTGLSTAKAASTICLLAGIWLFVSPWVYGAYANGNAWNSWVVGGFMILFGIIRIVRPAYSTVLSWCNLILGFWTFFSPWLYGYAATNSARFINSICIGGIVAVFSFISLRAAGPRNAPARQSPYTRTDNPPPAIR